MNAAAVAASPQQRTVALVGRPNAGKTSLLMHLTGTVQRPVNFPGTSVECNESRVRIGDTELCIVDLPGIASLRSISRDEEVAIGFLRGSGGRRPDLLCCVLDASRLAVELRFLQQVRSLGLPIVVALTKVDVAQRQGRPVDSAALQRALGLPLCVVDAARGQGIAALRTLLAQPLPAGQPPPTAVPASGAGADAAAISALAAAVQPAAARRSRSDRLDAVLLHPWLGPIALAGILLLTFQLVFTVAEPFMQWIEAGQELVAGAIEAALPAGALRSFLVDGLVNGLGSALVFVPQIALLIGFVTVLESSGYMARAVFLLDRLLRHVGLTGRSFVPLASGFACAIPGILATRILDDERDRLTTIAVLPLMSCSARLPVYVVLLAAFFPAHQAGLLLLALYLLGIAIAAVVAFVLRRTALRGGSSLLAMEVPVYQRPRLRVIALHVWASVREFLRTAGSVILVATIVVWFLSYYPRPADIHQRFEVQRVAAPAGEAGGELRARLDAEEAAAYLEQSWIADLGRTVQPVFAPAGFDWRLVVGILAAFPARELVIPTLGTLYSLGTVEADPDAPDPNLREALVAARDEHGRPTLNGLVALALMVFFALCSQCAATLAAIRRETHSWRWPLFTFAYMTTLAWLAAVLVHQVGCWLGYGIVG